MLKSLHIRNFQSVREAKLDLARYNLVAIVGEVDKETDASNGAGKSTIGEAILVTWYGKTSPGRDIFTYMKDDAEEMYLELVWTMTEHGKEVEYKVVRQIKKKGRTHKRELFVAGSDKPFGGGKTETDRYIETVLGADFETLTAANVFRQREDDAFTSAKVAKRKEYLKNIIGMRLYDEAGKIASRKAHETEKSLVAATSQRDTYQKELDDLSLIDFDGAFKQADENLDKCKTIISECETTKKAYEDQLYTLRSVQENYQTTQNLVTSYKDRLTTITDSKNSLTADVTNVRAQLTQINNAKVELDRLTFHPFDVARYQELPAKIQSVIGTRSGCMGKASVFENMVTQVESLANNCPTCHQDIQPSHKDKLLQDTRAQIKELKDRAATAESELGVLQTEYNNMKSVEIENNQINAKRTELQGLVANEEALTNRVTAAQETIAKLAEEEKTVKAQYDEALIKLKSLPKYSEATAIQYKNGIIAQDQKITETRDIENQYHDYIGSLKTKQARISELKNSIKDIDKNSKDLKKEMHIHNICAEAYSKNGIPALIIDNMFPIIEESANNILAQIDNKHKLEMSSLKSKVGGGASEGLDIWVHNLVKNTKRLYETYSGGESTFINIAVRKAISDLLANRKFKRLPFLWMDEVFAFLDTKNRESVIKCMNLLKQEFEQIFIISHTGLQFAIPDIIKAVKTGEDTVYIQ